MVSEIPLRNQKRPFQLALRCATAALTFAVVADAAVYTDDAGTDRQPDVGAVELLFADPLIHAKPEDRCEDTICTRLLELIRGARISIAFAVYGTRKQTELLKALEAAKSRGVAVRGIVDRDRNGNNVYSSTNLWMHRLGSVRDDFETEQILDAESPSKFGNRIMHNKFFIVDGRWIWTGSANVSDSGTGGYNANVVAVIDSPPLAAVYTQEFEQMWSGRFHQLKQGNGADRLEIGNTDVAVWFSPQDNALSRGVRKLIADAQRSITLGMFYLTDESIANELMTAHERGVDVRVIIDATAAGSRYTQHERLREIGIPVKVEHWGGKMHVKAAVIDGRVFIVGSMNWSYSGDNVNDENTLVLRSARLAGEFESFFDRLWDSIPPKWGTRSALPDPESPDSSPSCTDDVDNDFDRLIDGQDPGCGDG